MSQPTIVSGTSKSMAGEKTNGDGKRGREVIMAGFLKESLKMSVQEKTSAAEIQRSCAELGLGIVGYRKAHRDYSRQISVGLDCK